MLSLTTFPLFCALLLCLPVAIVFTVTKPNGSDPGNKLVSIFSLDPRDAAGKTQKLHFRTLTPPLPPPLPEDDKPLLRMASRVNPNLRLGSTRKIAFMFLTTTHLPFAPLWEMFFNGSSKDLYNVYVHADPSYDYGLPFSGVFVNRVIHSKPARRFTPTLISAARRLLAHALLHDRQNYMFALLSPSCIPLHSFNFTYTTLASSRKSFIEILKDEPWQYDRWAARGPDAMLPEVKLEDFRIGSQFWVLTRRHARLVVRDRTLWDKFNQPCMQRDSCYPEENYFPTLIHMRDPGGCVPATLTHVDWTVNEDGHPRMYEPEEVEPDLILRLRSARPRYGGDGINSSDRSLVERYDPFLFARKFSPMANLTMLSMGRSVIFNDSARV